MTKSSVWHKNCYFLRQLTQRPIKHELSKLLLCHMDDFISHPHEIEIHPCLINESSICHRSLYHSDELPNHPYEIKTVFTSYGISNLHEIMSMSFHTDELLRYPYEITCGCTNMPWLFYSVVLTCIIFHVVMFLCDVILKYSLCESLGTLSGRTVYTVFI